MKIKILSDLHLEGYWFTYEDHGEDVVILAGDICTRNRLHMFLDTIPKHIKVLFVAGNHEYYHGEFKACNQYFKDLESKYNFVFLKNNQIIIDDIAFFGGTMFTDFKLYNNPVMHSIDAMMGISDFSCIQIDDRKWSTNDHIDQFFVYKQKLSDFLYETKIEKKIVISHFMPHLNCISEKFKGDKLNAYFAREMNEYMSYNGYWIAGHGHSCKRFKHNNVEVIMNPRGYGKENPEFKPDLIIEV